MAAARLWRPRGSRSGWPPTATPGLRAARAGGYDVVVLDVMLPRRDGFVVLESLRQCHVDTPVLFISARDAVEDRLRGLGLGAEDFLVKPFAPAELAARVRAILRRTAGGRRDVREPLRVADLEVDLLRRRVARRGRPLHLTSKELAILSLLVCHKGEVISRRFIGEQVWGRPPCDHSNLIDVHVRRLRAKVDDPYDRSLIHTVRGVGYSVDDRQHG